MKCKSENHYDNIWSMGECLTCGEKQYNIKKLKQELNISNQDIADMFDMSYNAYANSSAKQRYERALCRFYECVLLGGKKEN